MKPQGCRGKVRLSESRAIEAVRNMERKTGLAFHRYVCHHCGKWHVGRVKRTVGGVVTSLTKSWE